VQQDAAFRVKRGGEAMRILRHREFSLTGHYNRLGSEAEVGVFLAVEAILGEKSSTKRTPKGRNSPRKTSSSVLTTPMAA